MRIYPLAGDADAYLLSGPGLLDGVDAESGPELPPLEEWTTDFPSGGFHIDVPSRMVEFWTARDRPDVLARVAGHWPDWTVRWHEDAFEFQLERTRGLLRFPTASRASLEEQVVGMLLQEPGRSGADLVQELVAESRAEGKEATVNPWVSCDVRLDVPLDVRRTIVAQALSGSVTGEE
jgi:hypothetical protein